MIFLLSLKGFAFSPIMIPVPFITFVFHIAVIYMFYRPWTMISVHDAALLDRKDQV